MSTADITAFIQSEGKVRFDQQLRRDLDWKRELCGNILENVEDALMFLKKHHRHRLKGQNWLCGHLTGQNVRLRTVRDSRASRELSLLPC